MSVATGSGRSSSWWRTRGCIQGRQPTSAPGACRGSSSWPAGTTTSAPPSRVTNSFYGDYTEYLCAMRMLLLPLLLLNFNKLLFIVYSQLLCNLIICVLSTALPLLPGLYARPAQAPADPLGRPQQGEPQGVGGEHSHPPALALAQLLTGERG